MMAMSIHPQAQKLDTLISAAALARRDSARGMLFCSPCGLALVNAAFDLFECDALYDIAADIRSELGLDDDGWSLDEQGDHATGAER
jgi:hypothetical protein